MLLLAMKMAFWRANSIKATKALMKGWDREIQFDVEGMDSFHVVVQGGRASVRKGKSEKQDLTIKSSTANFRKIIRGEVNFEEAFIRKQVDAIGSIRDASIFKRIFGVTMESHKGTISIARKLFGKFI